MIASLVSPRMMRVGGGAVAQTAEVLAAFGLTRPLVVTDPYMVSSGLVRRCLDPMEAAGLKPVVFSQTVPEPTDVGHRGRGGGAGTEGLGGSGGFDCLVGFGGWIADRHGQGDGDPGGGADDTAGRDDAGVQGAVRGGSGERCR